MVKAARIAALAVSALSLASCNTTEPPASDLAQASTAAPPPPASLNEGVEPRYCPKVTLREGTAILRKENGDKLDYVASISDTTRDCRVVDGQLRMAIGVAGRMTPGPGAKSREISLPIRIAIVRGGSVLYSQLGQEKVIVDKSKGVQQFTYIDSAISVPEPKQRDLVIYAGFDEGPTDAQ